MADDVDDVLELEGELVLENKPIEAEADGDEDDHIGFGEPEGEGDAPPLEVDNSAVREMRTALRRITRERDDLRRQVKPQQVEVGDKPSLSSCEFDEDRFEVELDAWKQRKADADRSQIEEQNRAKDEQARWKALGDNYVADKSKIRVADFDSAEGEVFGVLSEAHQALIMLVEKPAALVYALSRDPAKLEQLSKLDLARAAILIGKLEDKVTVTSKRNVPQPDRPVRGNAPISTVSTDKELARLEKEAERTGNRTALIAYRKKLRA